MFHPDQVLADFVRDFRYAFRAIRKASIFTFFAVLSLGLGIGANTTVFTIINTLLLHPLPVRDAQRLAVLYDTRARSSNQAGARLPLSYVNFEDYAKRQEFFDGVAAYTPPQVMTLHGETGSERVFEEYVTSQYFETLGLAPTIGRFFLPAEDRERGSAPVAVLSYGAWMARFGGSTAVLGRTLELNNTAFTVIGVAPERFLGVSALFGPDVWLPATMSELASPAEFRSALSDRSRGLFHGLGRLRTGMTLTQANANLQTISAALEREFPAANEGHAISARPITDELYSNAGGSGGLAFGSAVLLAIVALVLGIACSNVANLLLARAAARSQEVAVRLAIGATRGRLVRQMLTESLLLSLLSFVAGIAMGYAGCRFVWSFVPAEVTQNMVTPRLDAMVLACALGVSLLTTFLFGLAPALRASKTELVVRRSKVAANVGKLLLAGQVAFSLVCLIIATLFFRSVQRAYVIDPGFDTGHLALLMMNPTQAGYDETRTREFYRAARDRVSTLPGVSSASWSSGLPFWNSPSRSLAIEGAEPLKKSESLATVALTVDTDYFQTAGIRLVEGRQFRDTDRDGSLPVAIVNEALARQHWPGGGALGHRLQLAGDQTPRQVIGVAKTANYTTLGEAPQPCVYLPARQNFSGGMTLYVRSQADPATVLGSVQREIRNLDSNIHISDVRTGVKLMDQVLWGPKVGVALLGVFGLLALLLAAVGLYGVMAYSLARRTKEIGVRMALGASRSSVLRLVIRDGMALVLWGIAAGLGICLLSGHVLSRMLFGISSADPLSLAAASLVLIVVAFAACYLPARSATRIDPLAALRES